MFPQRCSCYHRTYEFVTLLDKKSIFLVLIKATSFEIGPILSTSVLESRRGRQKNESEDGRGDRRDLKHEKEPYLPLLAFKVKENVYDSWYRDVL